MKYPILIIIYGCIGSFCLLFLIGGYLFTQFGILKRIYHDWLGWHQPEKINGFDGCSFTGKCRYCGKKILMDSNGDWF